MWHRLLRQIRYRIQFIPFTLNTLLCAAAAWLLYKILWRKPPAATDYTPSTFQPFIVLMGKLVFWFALAILALSVLSALLTWLYYLYLRRKETAGLQLQFETVTKNGRRNRLFMEAALPGVRRPLLGFVKGRLFYDDYQLTDKFPLQSNEYAEGKLLRRGIRGRSRLLLPDIREYQLRGGFVYFEDMLHLFSFAAAQPLSGTFYQPPVLRNVPDAEVAPRKTESLDIRIDQMRRVEGDPLAYKDFEPGDDVRRIVWKVYARNRELVVRMPERFEPYASHLYFYASFYAATHTAWLDDGYFKEMLNYYKNRIWTIYDTLAAKEWALRYIPDQEFTLPETRDDAEKTARLISSSAWHQDRGLLAYFDQKAGTVLCISSFTDPAELQQLLESAGAGVMIYFVKTSRVFRHFAAWNWLKRLVLLPPRDRLNRLRSRWIFSPVRWQVRKQEKQLLDILKNSGITYDVV